jgi:UDP-GlcNAc3NAcA epimerase
MTVRILTVVGARPQFIKAAAVSVALKDRDGVQEVLLHTGQHFDPGMSDVFFDQLALPKPRYRLNIHGGNHGQMTGRMLEAIEEALLVERPDRVLVYGDTNSTLAGALAATKLHIPVAHVEAGLRSFDVRMPEEINRLLTDRISDLLLCPTPAAIRNLGAEGVTHSSRVRVLEIGDVMLDAARRFGPHATQPKDFDSDGPFLLATVHRAENTDDPLRLRGIVDALNRLSTRHRIVLPLHPRTAAAMQHEGLRLNFGAIAPVGYLEMLWLLNRCSCVLTDSGGVQKEAFFAGRPCVTLRDSTEWVELVDLGANVLAGADARSVETAAEKCLESRVPDVGSHYGGGNAAAAVAEALIGT